MTDTLTFRPITRADIPLLHRWRNLPHVSQWWHPSNPSYADAQAEYTAYMRPNYGVAAYIMQINGVDVGFIQLWHVRDFPDYKPFVPLTGDIAGVDVFIGEVSYLHKGWGPRLMHRFFCDYVFKDPAVSACIIDPLPENTAAIRAYAKSGFRHERTFTYQGRGVYLMRLRRDQVDCAG